MPLNFVEFQSQATEIGTSAPEVVRQLGERKRNALALLNSNANNIQQLREKVEKYAVGMRDLRSAKPVKDSLVSVFPLPESPTEAILIGADGSQINPDRNSPVNFAVINTGCITLPINIELEPRIRRDTKTIYGDQLYLEGRTLSEDEVRFRRDLRERQILTELIEELENSEVEPIVTFTDGQLELWVRRGPQPEKDKFIEKRLGPYRKTLLRLQELDALPVGYVDKPKAVFLVDLLEITGASNLEEYKDRSNRLFQGIVDTSLLNDILVTPGDRSAVFEIQSKETEILKQGNENLGLYFFYMNVGWENKPWLVRIEIPGWIVENDTKLNTIHAIVYQQCLSLGNQHYPYILHRAHEEAMVSMEEKEEALQILIAKLRQNNVTIGEESQKQSSKNLFGRRRFNLNARKR